MKCTERTECNERKMKTCHQRHLLSIKNIFPKEEYFKIRIENQCHLLFTFKDDPLKRFLRHSKEGAVYSIIFIFLTFFSIRYICISFVALI